MINRLVLFGLLAFLVSSLVNTRIAEAQTTTFTFGAAGDYANGTNFQATVDAVAGQNPNFQLALGDLSYSSGAESSWCGKWKAKFNNILLIAGNHDTGESSGGNIGNYVQYCPFTLTGLNGNYGHQYYFDYPSNTPLARFIMIRPGVGGSGVISYNAGGAGYNFTQSAIDEARAKGIPWIIVGFHKNYISAMEKSNEIGTDLMKMLLDKKIDLILQGHEHGYERSKQLTTNSTTCTSLSTNTYNANCVVDSDNNLVKGAGTIIHVIGTGGQGLRGLNTGDSEYQYFAKADNTTYGFGKFTVSVNQLSYNFVRSAGGNFTDSFTIASGTIPPPTPTPTKSPTATPTPTKLPTPTPTPPPIPTNAFSGQYYDNLDFTNLTHTRIDPVIDFQWQDGSPAPGVGPDTFSVRWEGNWDFTQAGTYRFTAETDDGMRVWVDGQLIIDSWKQQAATVYTADLNLAAGTHRIKVEYYEDPELAVARLSWALTSTPTPTTKPTATLTPTPPPLPGDINKDGVVNILDFQILSNAFGTSNPDSDLNRDATVNILDFQILSNNFGRTAPTDTIPTNAFRGQYFNNLDFTNLVHTRTDAVIDFNWGLGSPAPGVDPDTFSVRWEGNWDFAQASTYRFTAKTDDGMRVWVDDQLIIDSWKQQAATVYTADLNLAAGTHRIKVEYYEDPELAIAGLSWKLAVGPTPTPPPTGTPTPPPPPPPPPGDILSRKDLIYGTEIGTWPWGDAYDGHPLTANATCRQLARDAKISVVRWSPLEPFDDMGSVGGVSCSALKNGCLMPRVQFDNVINGIVDIGALPLIKTAPGWRQCEADGFTTAAYAGWFKEIVKQAGSRVQLYELSNEANYYCGWSAEKYAQSWIQIIPQVKQYARSLGLEIYVGGSSWSNPNFNALKTFMETVKAEYDRTGNRDLIPSFISFHTYPAWSTASFTQQDVLNQIPEYGNFIRNVRSESLRIFGYELPVADSEYNYTSSTGGGSRWDYDVSFMDKFTRGMLTMFRDSGAWMGIQFTFASGGDGGTIDMVEANCTPKPQFNTFKEVSISDSLR